VLDFRGHRRPGHRIGVRLLDDAKRQVVRQRAGAGDDTGAGQEAAPFQGAVAR
jgi:hypothetical protein